MEPSNLAEVGSGGLQELISWSFWSLPRPHLAGQQAPRPVSHVLPAGVARVEHLPVILGSGLRSEQLRSSGIRPKVARFKPRSVEPQDSRSRSWSPGVSWPLDVSLALVSGLVPQGWGRREKDILLYTGRDQGRRTREDRATPSTCASRKAEGHPGDGDGGGKQDGKGGGSKVGRCLHTPDHPLVPTPCSCHNPPATPGCVAPCCDIPCSLPQPACCPCGIYNPHYIPLIWGLNGMQS